MGLQLFREVAKVEKPFQLKVKMTSEIVANGLPALAKHILWIEENIPNEDRNLSFRQMYDPYNKDKFEITVTWNETRGNKEEFDV
jgi:hypothetical protein